MDRGAWQARVYSVTESDTTEAIKHTHKVKDVLILNLFDGLFTNTRMSYHHRVQA